MHFGHDNIWGPYDLRTKMFDPGDTRIPNVQLKEWVFELDRPVTIRQVSERIDVENLTRWFLSVLFCGTGGCAPATGAVLRQLQADRELVLDQLGHGPELPGLECRFPSTYCSSPSCRVADWGRVLGPTGTPRPLALSSLLADDEEYREYFQARACTDAESPDHPRLFG